MQGTISKRLAIDMINAMYSHDETKKNEIVDELNQVYENLLLATKSPKVRTKDELKYKDLEKLVLDNLVRTHHSYLNNIRVIFRKQDTTNFGYINHAQFNDLLQSIDELDGFDRDRLYDLINPGDVEHITFSELVRGFAQNQVVKDENQLTILDYIFSIESC